ncbi:MAG: tRNA 4-thiouridine(8) synthase ThiI [Spirochaetaceae bacterium]|nr:tRNA 4-thiouridine(8) synthase ThiI [Spirochaetaceae bacterium]HPG24276.1 tRNA uracil 4-sulfurtransferase ThiI [Myxococcota bacterium]
MSSEGAPRSPSPEAPEGGRLLLVRLSGDLTTKGDATRRRMTSRLAENLRASIKQAGRSARVVRERSRIFVELAPLDPAGAAVGARPPVDDDAMVERLARVFGIQSVSLVHAEDWTTLDDLVRTGERFGAPFVAGQRFAIRARRVGDRTEVPLRSGDVERALGERLLGASAGVDLRHPDVTVFIEIGRRRAWYFVAKTKGAGGLPLGTEGRAVSLLSGGFDSPVASWRLLRRGVAIDYVFCNLGGRQHQLETLAIAKCLADRWQCGTRPRFHAIDFDAVSREIQDKVTTRYWQIVLKRMMLRAAEAVAAQIDAAAIVTGEAIGQVSSQTLQNLAVISDGARLPILRPLVGNNKDEIIAESRVVGTHDLSAKVGEYCAIVPSRPATNARLADVLAEEAKLDPGVLEEALAGRSEFLLPDLDLDAWTAEDLSARTIDAGDTVIDLRSKAAYDGWHFPGALFLDFANALRAYPSFDAGQHYVLYCEFGLKSAHLADLMRRAGLDARHVSGGLREVRRLAEVEA